MAKEQIIRKWRIKKTQFFAAMLASPSALAPSACPLLFLACKAKNPAILLHLPSSHSLPATSEARFSQHHPPSSQLGYFLAL